MIVNNLIDFNIPFSKKNCKFPIAFSKKYFGKLESIRYKF